MMGGAPPADSGLPPRLSEGRAVAEQPGIAGLYSPCGFTVVGNSGNLHFRMELAGNKVSLQHGSESDIFVVDGLRVQTTVVDADTIGPSAAPLTGIQLLRAHAAWESAHLSSTLGRQARPEEVEILAADNTPAALVWWFAGAEGEGGNAGPDGYAATADNGAAADPAAAEPNHPTGIVFVTSAFGSRVLVMSVQGLRGERKAELVAKGTAWLATLTTSSRSISIAQTAADLKEARSTGRSCPGRSNAIIEEAPAPGEAAAEVDRNLRFDGLSDQDKSQAMVLAQANGGVARLRTPAGLQYTNYICRCQYLLPPGWQEYSVQDFNGHGCSLNLTTAEVIASGEPKPVSNAVAIVAAAGSELDRETLHQRMLFTLKNGKARIVRVTPSLLEPAIQDHFQTDKDGHPLEGDLFTFQRGDLLYQILFSGTPGAYAAGKAGFAQFLASAKWGAVDGK
jgi:hypothetical protein